MHPFREKHLWNLVGFTAAVPQGSDSPSSARSSASKTSKASFHSFHRSPCGQFWSMSSTPSTREPCGHQTSPSPISTTFHASLEICTAIVIAWLLASDLSSCSFCTMTLLYSSLLIISLRDLLRNPLCILCPGTSILCILFCAEGLHLHMKIMSPK